MPATALIVEVPESEPVVYEYRAKFDEVAKKGIPAHITVLYPFMTLEEITDSVVSELRNIALETTSFPFQLVEWGTFETALWLRPNPEKPFIQITENICNYFPNYLPYENKHNQIQPHLTVAQFEELESGNPEWDLIVKSTKTSLPITSIAKFLSVYACDSTGYWKKQISLPFGDVK